MSRKPLPSIEMLLKQAYEQLREEDFRGALDTFSAVLAIEPATPAAFRGRGIAFFQLKEWAPAAEAFRRASELSPEDTDNAIDLGLSLAMDGQIYPALEAFETLLAKHPTCVRAHVELGMLYIRLGAIPKGRQQLEKALSLRPTMQERKFIQTTLGEQAKLDRKRYYRPDFEALHRQEAAKRSGKSKQESNS